MSSPSPLALTSTHLRYQFLETVRIPVAVIGTTLFPSLAFLFFVVPQPFAQEAASATAATSQLAVFAVMSVCLFTYGVGLAEDRSQPWYGFLRTLPAGPGPQLLGRVLNGFAFALMGLAPLVVIAWIFTAATLPPGRLALAVGALAAAAAPMLAAGLTIGYSLSSKAAIAVAQALLLPLAFGGGLFLPPEMFPGWLDAISTWLPTRAGRDLMVWATTGADLPGAAVPVLLGWTIVTGALAVWAYRRDEGRRFH